MSAPYYLRRPELDEEEPEGLVPDDLELPDFAPPEPPPAAPKGLEALERYAKPRTPAGSGVAELEAAQGEDRRQGSRDRFSEALFAAGMRQPARLSVGPGKADELLQRRALAGQEQATERQGFRDELALLQAKAKLQPAKSTGDDDYKRAMAERLRALTEREKATTALKTEQSEQDDAELEADRAALGKLFPGHDLSKMSRKGIEALLKQLNLSEAQKQRLREKTAGAASARTKAEAKEAAKKGEGDLRMTDAMRREFNGLPEVKAYNDVSAAYDKIQSAAADPSAAGDLSLIFAYMKMLDPGSTVREGEFANAQNAGGMDDRLRNQYNRVVSGERLNPEQRSDFLRQAKHAFGAHVKQYEEAAKRYQGIAQRRGLAPEDVAASRAALPQAPAGDASLDAPQTMEVGGKKYVRRNGKWFAQE